MNLIIVHRNKPTVTQTADSYKNLLKFALTDETIASVVLDGLSRCLRYGYNGKALYAVPVQWHIESDVVKLKKVTYVQNVSISSEFLQKAKQQPWLTISNAQFPTYVDAELIDRLLGKNQADVVVVNVEPDLLGKREKMRLTAHGKVAGFHDYIMTLFNPLLSLIIGLIIFLLKPLFSSGYL